MTWLLEGEAIGKWNRNLYKWNWICKEEFAKKVLNGENGYFIRSPTTDWARDRLLLLLFASDILSANWFADSSMMMVQNGSFYVNIYRTLTCLPLSELNERGRLKHGRATLRGQSKGLVIVRQCPMLLPLKRQPFRRLRLSICPVRPILLLLDHPSVRRPLIKRNQWTNCKEVI